MFCFITNRSARLVARVPWRHLCNQKRVPSLLRHASRTPYRPIAKIQPRIPDVLLIYHAGTWSTVALGVTKVATIIVFLYTAVILAPTTWKEPSGGPWLASALVLGALVPIGFTMFYTRPFVMSIHIRLPMHARESLTALASFVDGLPPSTILHLTVMRTIPVPATRIFRTGELRKIKSGFGSIANLGLHEGQGVQSFSEPTSFLKESSKKFYVGDNKLPQYKAAIWAEVWKKIPWAR